MSVLVKLQQHVDDAQEAILKGDMRTYQQIHRPKIDMTAAEYTVFEPNDRKRLAKEIDRRLRSHTANSPGVDVFKIASDIQNS